MKVKITYSAEYTIPVEYTVEVEDDTMDKIYETADELMKAANNPEVITTNNEDYWVPSLNNAELSCIEFSDEEILEE